MLSKNIFFLFNSKLRLKLFILTWPILIDPSSISFFNPSKESSKCLIFEKKTICKKDFSFELNFKTIENKFWKNGIRKIALTTFYWPVLWWGHSVFNNSSSAFFGSPLLGHFGSMPQNTKINFLNVGNSLLRQVV